MRVLVVQTAYLGDLVLTTPFLRELRRVAPAAAVDLWTTPTGAALFSPLPWVDTVLVHDKRDSRPWWRGLGGRARSLRERRYDVVVAAHRSLHSALLVRASGASTRIGFSGGQASWAYNRRVPWHAERHAVRRYLELARPLGGDPEGADPAPALRLEPRARQRVEALLRAHEVATERPLVCVAPGSIWNTKRWMTAGFSAVVDGARRRGLQPLLIGTAAERALCLDVACGCRVPPPVLAGSTSIPELAALLARAEALIANDSGPGHVASAVGTPVVTIFGPTVPDFGYAPRGERNHTVEHPDLDCRPCDRHGPAVCPRGHFRCMREIGPAQVLEALDRLLSDRAAGQAQAVRPG